MQFCVALFTYSIFHIQWSHCQPTTPTAQTSTPTKAPSLFYACGSDSYTRCYDHTLTPIAGHDVSDGIVIQQGYVRAQTTYIYNVELLGSVDCVRPTIDFSFERIDNYYSSEYLSVIYGSTTLATCGTTNSCNNQLQCISDYSIGSQITTGNTITITVIRPINVHAGCTAWHSWAINAVLNITCNDEPPTVAPTLIPTVITSSPTKRPSAPPTMQKCSRSDAAGCYQQTVGSYYTTSTYTRTLYIQAYDGNAQDIYDVYFTASTNCYSPYISVNYRPMDDMNPIQLWDKHERMLGYCSGSIQCSSYRACLTQYDLGIDVLVATASYNMIVYGQYLANDCNYGRTIDLHIRFVCGMIPTTTTGSPTTPTTDPMTGAPTAPTQPPMAVPTVVTSSSTKRRTSPPTNAPSDAPTKRLCEGNEVRRNAPKAVDDFIVVFEINCITETLLVNITYSTYDDKWFGLVFAQNMLGDALVWTTGKHNDRELGLYAYNNVNKMGNGSGVEYTPDKNWRQRVVTRRRLELNIIYEQDLWLGFGDITADQDAIAFRWVTGDTLQLEYHNRSSNYDELYLENVATSTPQYDDLAETYEIVFIVFVSFFVIMGLSAWVDAKYMRMNDYLNITQLAGMAIQSLDMLSDCFFAINVSIGHTMDPKYSLALIFTIIFIVVPAFMTILQLHYQCKRWTHSSDKVRGWLSSNLKELYFLSMCTGSSFAAIMFVNSYVFQLEVCDMGLTDKELKEFSYKRVYSVVLFENIPQLVLQIWYLWSISTLDDAITITSIVLSVISILISVLSMLTERNIAQSQGYAAISIKLTGRAITSSSKNCKTLKRVLTEQLALLVGVDPSVVEVLKPTHIKQGFHLNVNFYFDDVNKPWIDYHQILLSASTTQQLQEVFRQSWQLPTKPDIHDIRVTIIESIIARNTAEPTTIVETKKLISDTYPIQCPQKVEIK
eukprot:396897_1